MTVYSTHSHTNTPTYTNTHTPDKRANIMCILSVDTLYIEHTRVCLLFASVGGTRQNSSWYGGIAFTRRVSPIHYHCINN